MYFMKVTRFSPVFAILFFAGLLVTSRVVGETPEFSMQIMDSFKIEGAGTVLTGQVSSGKLTVGDTVCVPLKSGKKVARTVDGIERFNKLLEIAETGDTVGVLVADVDHKEVEIQTVMNSNCK